MKLKKIAKFTILIVIGLALVGCDNKQNKTNSMQNNQSNSSISNADTYDLGYLEISEEETKDMKKMICTREANGEGSSEVKLNYTLYYQGDYLQILHSKEQVITENQDILDEYQNAYIKIYKNYENLEYYDTSIVREKNSITNDTIIKYNKLDTKKLLEIEGEEDNIIKDGKVKLDDWLKFAEQFSTTCDNA